MQYAHTIDNWGIHRSNEISLYVTALSLSTDGLLNITRGPKDNEESFEMDLGSSQLFIDNRTGISILGSTMDSNDNLLLKCDFEYIGTAPGSNPFVVWIRNGTEVMKDANHNIDDTFSPEMSSTLQITGFALTDAGEYQCIFTDDDADAEIVMSQPYRLDTGKPKHLQW